MRICMFFTFSLLMIGFTGCGVKEQSTVTTSENELCIQVEAVNNSNAFADYQLSKEELAAGTDVLLDYILSADLWWKTAVFSSSVQDDFIYRALSERYNVIPILEGRQDAAAVIFSRLATRAEELKTGGEDPEKDSNYYVLRAIVSQEVYFQQLTKEQQKWVEAIQVGRSYRLS